MKKQTKIFLVLGILLLVALAYFYPRLGNQGADLGIKEQKILLHPPVKKEARRMSPWRLM